MNRTRIRPRLYPTMLALASVLNLFSQVAVSPYSAIRLLLVLALVTLLVTFVLTWLIGDADKGALASFVLLAAFVGGRQVLVLALAVLVLGVLVAYWRLRRDGSNAAIWPRVTRGLTIVTTVLILAIGIRAVQDGKVEDVVTDLALETNLPSLASPGVSAGNADRPPDIYLILLDGYLRLDKHASLLGEDDAWFGQALSDRGFDIAEQSRSNYAYTHFSLTSLFEMRHMPEIVATTEGPFRPRRWIVQSRVFTEVREHGYEITTIAPGWDEVSLRGVDRYLDTGLLSEFETMYLENTAAAPVMELLAPDVLTAMQRRRIVGTLDLAAAEASGPSSRPRFVFAHVPAPHAPFVFGAHGEPRDDPVDMSQYTLGSTGPDRAAYLRDYRDHLEYVSRLTLDAIDEIVDRSSKPPVIVLFSDHGSRSAYDLQFDPPGAFDEATANLLAVLTPGRDGLLPEDTTLVNVMGPILEAYLGTTYQQQPDLFYLRTDAGFVEVQRPPE